MIFKTAPRQREPGHERRRYRRLDQIFPVEFQFLDEEGRPRTGWRQGFTQDVSDGGLCLTMRLVHPDDVRRLEAATTSLALQIHIPYSANIRAAARPVWLRCVEEGLVNTYVAGLDYRQIDRKDLGRMRRYIGVRRFVKVVMITFTLILTMGLASLTFYNTRLRLENERLLGRLNAQLLRQQTLARDRENLAVKLDEMEFDLAQADRQINSLSRDIEMTSARSKKEAAVLRASLDFYKKYQAQLNRDIAGLKEQAVEVERQVKIAAHEAQGVEGQLVDRFYQWLIVHRNRRTGLLASFEGDAGIKDWAFTYDQSLAAVVFALKGQADYARQIFDFYRTAERIDGGAVINAYYASTGGPAEYIAHAGPNIWLGLAVLQYTHRTRDTSYLDLATGIAEGLATLTDGEGGIRGNRKVTWCSTEHNLDAYAFYKMLAVLTGQARYRERAEQTLAWLSKNAYSRLSDPLVKRGKGDATIATDTYAWSIASVGPRALKEMGMDPDQIIEFALAQCSVTTGFKKSDGTSVRVKGFDFAKEQHLPRGGIISCEWTGQMIMAFKIMAAYHEEAGASERARHYRNLARDGISELTKMVVTSPSPVGQGDFCLPYASHELADTGHGWYTPRGHATGSVAATAYAILAIEGFNPLSLDTE